MMIKDYNQVIKWKRIHMGTSKNLLSIKEKVKCKYFIKTNITKMIQKIQTMQKT